MTRLKNLSLSGNLFDHLPTVLTRLPALHRLDMSANRLTFLPEEILSGLAHLEQLDLRDNPLPKSEIDKARQWLPGTEVLHYAQCAV